MNRFEDKTAGGASDASRFILDNGRSIRLSALHQTPTYYGLLEGLPTDRMNDAILQSVLLEAKKLTHSRKAHLIAPIRTPTFIREDYPFGKPERLPSIQCIGLFQSEIIKTNIGGYSEIALGWFQQCFALPIEPEPLKQLLALDWDWIAYDITFDEY